MKHFFRPLALGLSAGLLAAAPAAADLLAGSAWVLLTPPGGAALQTAPGAPLHVTVKTPTKNYYAIQLTHDIAAALPVGATVRYHFQARSPSRSAIHAVIEKRTAPYTHLMDKLVTLAPSWTNYAFTAKVPAAYGPRGLGARLQLGQQAGTIEFKDISVTKG